MRALTATAERRHWEPTHLLGIGMSVYVISLALYSGLRPDGALSIHSTEGISRFIAAGYVIVGVAIGLICMAYVVIRDSLRPMAHIAAYLLAFATLALFRVETSWVANAVNCLRFLAMASVATGAWLHHVREACRAHQ